MHAAAPPSLPAPQIRYVDLLVDSSHAHELGALETIREAGQSSEAAAMANSLRPSGTAAPPHRKLATRVPTPERIRRVSARLYEDIHAIMDRHNARTRRELDLRRHGSHSARVSYVEERLYNRHQKATDAPRSSPTEKTALPDVHQLFDEARRAHLAEAQEQRTYFPSSSKPTVYSSKNPSTFSYRFQSHPSANGST
ncbi:hypothetical protein LSCM1_05819 [Leishmania martiniquensis]|uniref:Uncharacterized protein n=1 Tax=Leishmania martiniquensis TaxID=1580590 RepID=A0A836H391_9TRYP|nr:hypothetical protein LSCM1_05819 [Leishmania martiniquensis]